MCTVSIISVPGGLRIVCNRDESRRRPPAAGPRWRTIGDGPGRAIWPMDLEAGGTWIGASERGLSLCVLNLNPEPPIDLRGRGKLRSRGLVIPDLIGSTSLDEAARTLELMPLRRFAPFRMIGVAPDSGPILEARWDRRSLQTAWHAGPPLCFVSSGLGDGRVVGRLDLFEGSVVEPGATPERQDEFHRHTWPEAPELSVMMSREDARTVSVATLELRDSGVSPRVEMTYEAVREPAPAAVRR